MANKKKQKPSLDAMIKSFLDSNGFATKEDINQVLKKIEKIEKSLSGKPENGPAQNKKNKSASDKVLDVISDYEDGAKFDDIQAITQFDDKKLRNIIYRLTKQGKIYRPKRGIYIQS